MKPEEPPSGPGGPIPGEPPQAIAAGAPETERWGAELRAHRPSPELADYAWLLGLIVATFALEGVSAGSDLTRTLLTLLIAATTVLALRVARARPAVLAAGMVVAAALVLATLVELATGGVDDGAMRLSNAILVAIAPPAIFIGVIRRLRATRAVTVESVLGVICVYILIGMFFAFLYGAIDRLGSAPFFAQSTAATMSNCQYFSFTTLATVGYGDLTAASSLGHTLSVSEALLGQVYLVTVVSLIVGNLGRRRR